jgi:hypothetical protein
MRILILFVFFAFTLCSAAEKIKIPKKFRGVYSCELPSYTIEHDGNIIQVEASTASLTVSKTNAVLRVGKYSVKSELIRSKNAKSQYAAEFDTALYSWTAYF